MRLLRLATVLLALCALPATALAAPAAPSRTAAPAPTVIALVSVTTTAKDTDRPPKGASKGDRTVGASTLYNGAAQFGRKAGARVGSDRSVFTLRDPKTLHATGTATLPGGTIHFEGRATVKEGVFVIPVVGGTGTFAGVTGQLLIPIAAPGQTQVQNVYRLTYAPAA